MKHFLPPWEVRVLGMSQPQACRKEGRKEGRKGRKGREGGRKDIA
jgi:hypothetical protein